MVNSEPKIELGKSFLKLLDKSKINPTAFFWVYLHDANSWRLVISAKAYSDKDIKDSYKNFIDLFGNEELVKKIGLSNITIVPSTDGLLNLLKVAIVTPPTGVSGIRFTSSSINGVFIEDAYIYRLS